MLMLENKRDIHIFIFLMMINLILSTLSFSTSIYTPEGESIPHEFRDEFSAALKIYFTYKGDSLVTADNLHAVRIDSASDLYNCHGYAWRVSEGGSKCFIYTPGDDYHWIDDNYSNDGQASYISCLEGSATHVVYLPNHYPNAEPPAGEPYWADHSARKIQNSYPYPVDNTSFPGYSLDYVSKWGQWGLYIHEKGSDPYGREEDDYEFYKLKTTHYGTLTNHPKTWIGAGGQTHTITGDITIPSGVTLTINTGAIVEGNDHQISVYGTLKIIGTADAHVSISETYIYAYSGSTVEIDYADISDSYSHGLYVSSGTAKVNNSTFSSNDDIGIYLNYPQSGSEIENCTFTGNSDGGVKIYSGSPLDIKNCTFTGNGVFGLYLGSVNIPNDRIADNCFEDNYDGIYFASGGNANLTTTRPDPWDHQNNPGEAYLNNIIKDNDRYGAWVSYSSSPLLGSYTWIGESGGEYYWYGGFNAFVNAGAFKYIRNYGTSYIDIRLNFWDVDAEDVSDYLIGNFTQSEASNLYINPGSLSKSAELSIVGTYSNEKYQLSPLQVQLLEGDSLLITNHLDQAFYVYERIINNSPDANEARVALNRIIYIHWNQEKQDDLISWLNGIHVKYPKKLIGTIAYDYTTPLLVMKGDIDLAISRNDEVVNSYDRLNEPENAAESLYENMMIYENMAMESSGSGGIPKLNTAGSASKMFDYKNRIINDYPETSTAELLREEYHHELPEPISTIIPTEYELHACYPNPFNPVTNIVFYLPEESRVLLVIYDIMGRTVWEKPNNNSMMSPGQYTVQWNGTNMGNVQVATGIYFIRFMTPQYNQTRKVIIMK